MRHLLQEATQRLKNAAIDTAALDARLLLQHVLELSHENLLLDPDSELTTEQLAQFESLIALRATHKPIAQILGTREFWGLPFKVTEHTLIPRPDSETIITALLSWQTRRGSPLKMLDLGTGTGCLLLSALSEYPQSTGLGVDISQQSLAVAQENAENLGLLSRVEFKKSDWNCEINGVWDVVLSNPPYIPTADIAGLSPDVARFEPHLALDGGSSGLDCYRAITGFLPKILAEDGVALLEVGAGQAADVSALAAEQGLKVAQAVCDLAGIERCIVITK